MKQIIVIIASIVLGIAVAGMILAFETDAQTIADTAGTALETFNGTLQ